MSSNGKLQQPASASAPEPTGNETQIVVPPATTAVAVRAVNTQLTLWGAPRPPAPADPFIYDPETDKKEYCRSLLSANDAKAVDEELKKGGFMTIAQVREIVKTNTIKESMDARGETYAIDPEIMIVIDSRVNYKVFITGDNVYTREELYSHMPFFDLQTDPEDVFVQQEIGVFPARKYAMESDEFEYVARDVGDETVEFVMIEDMVGKVARKDYKPKRAPAKIVKTKIYLGKEKWDDFCLVHRFAKGVFNVTGGKGIPMFAALQPAAPRPLLMDEATIMAQQQRMEEAMKRREEEVRRREEEAQRREEETRKIEAKIQADVQRIEAMFGAMKKSGKTAGSVATKTAAESNGRSTRAEHSGAPAPAVSTRTDNIADNGEPIGDLPDENPEHASLGSAPNTAGADTGPSKGDTTAPNGIPQSEEDDSVPL